jgi:phage regulator Rha-like protein
MEITLAHIKEGMKMAKRSLGKKEHKKYNGSAISICQQIVVDCWNGKYFQVSAHGHFDAFYARDFGFCVDGLMRLGYRKQVVKTLEWAFEIYTKWNRLTTTITKDEVPIDIYDYACDTLPLLLKSLRVSKSIDLLKKHHDFINQQIKHYYNYVFDPHLALVDPKKTFSSMKDNCKRKSSMYDNSMMVMVSVEIEKLRQIGIKLVNPFNKWNFKKILLDRYWVGTHFLDDLSIDHHIATDANVFPYYCDIFHEKQMIESSILMIQKYKLDKPIPAKYTYQRKKEKEMFPLNVLAPNYEGDTCWAHLGLAYLYVVEKVNKHLLRHYLDVFADEIEKHKTFLELYDPKGKPYKTLLYKSDESMLWAAMFLDLYALL